MSEIKTAVCQATGKAFVPVRPWQRFADEKARNAFHNKRRAQYREEIAALKAQLAKSQADAAAQKDRGDNLYSLMRQWRKEEAQRG